MVRGRIFAASTMEYDAGPPTQCTCSDFTGILGGLWGIVLWALIGASSGGAYWMKALVIGALSSSVAMVRKECLIKGMALAAAGTEIDRRLHRPLNGAWTRLRAANAATEPGQSSIKK